MSERTELIWANDFFDFALILQVGYLWPKNVSSKGISLAAFGVRHTSIPLQNGRKITPYLASKRALPQRAGMEYKRSVITPTFTHLSTLENLKDPYTIPFLTRPDCWESETHWSAERQGLVTTLISNILYYYYHIFIFIQGHPYRPIGLLTGCPNQVHN